MKSKPERVKYPTDADVSAYPARQGGNVENTDVGPLNDATTKRQAILDFLSRHGGSLESAEGRGLTRPMAAAVGYDNLASLNGMLERMVKEGAIERHGTGGRTFRIALVGPRDNTPTQRPPIPEDRAGVADDASAALRQAQSLGTDEDIGLRSELEASMDRHMASMQSEMERNVVLVNAAVAEAEARLARRMDSIEARLSEQAGATLAGPSTLAPLRSDVHVLQKQMQKITATVAALKNRPPPPAQRAASGSMVVRKLPPSRTSDVARRSMAAASGPRATTGALTNALAKGTAVGKAPAKKANARNKLATASAPTPSRQAMPTTAPVRARKTAAEKPPTKRRTAATPSAPGSAGAQP